MRVGVFADTHDHLDNVRRAVGEFNRRRCELVLFAGDFVSTFVTPPLRRLACPFLGVFGDNDGNKRGLKNGITIVGEIGEPPIGLRLPDGTRILLAHMAAQLEGQDADVFIHAHTHKPRIARDDRSRLWLNPGETSGWTYRRPTIAVLETAPLSAEIVELPGLGPRPEPDLAPYYGSSGRGDQDSTR